MAENDLDPAERLVELRQSNLERVAALARLGFVLDEGNTILAFSYLRSCLEVLLGPALSDAQLLHERNVANILDDAEAAAEQMARKAREDFLAARGPNGAPPLHLAGGPR